MFRRWRRISHDDRRNVWRLYGWFSGLMLLGSCFGIATWAMYMQWNIYASKANDLFIQANSLSTELRADMMNFFALFAFWRGAFSVTYAIEFLCLTVAKLMVLDRMYVFLSLGSHRLGGPSRHWVVGGQFVMATAVAGNFVGLAGNIAAAVQLQTVAELWMAASAEWAANSTVVARSYGLQGLDRYDLAVTTLSLQACCEVGVLLLIVVAFSVVGIASFRRIGSTLSRLDAAGPEMADGRQLRLQIVGTSAVVFAAFLLRSVYSTAYALAAQLQNLDSCGGQSNLCDTSCYNVYTHIEVWLKRTPEFVLMIVLMTKPLPLLVALWGMTSKRMQNHMQHNERESVPQYSWFKKLITPKQSSI
jgi:hypothetical protein